MRRLTDKEFAKLADLSGTPDYYIQKLYSMGFLSAYNCVKTLMKLDYKEWIKRRVYRPALIIARLAEHYDVSRNTVLEAINLKPGAQRYCEECNRPVSGRAYNANYGLCDECAKRKIEL